MTYNFPTHVNNDTFDGVTFNLKVNGIAVDLTGAAIKLQLKKSPGMPSALDLISPDNIAIDSDPTTGIFSIISQIISVIEPGQYRYDIQITLADNTVRTYIEGIWIIKPDITQ